ncbi:MAG: hypothetical protein ACREM3_29410, partial [Candidatus Rokuibacteriota bacterium]
GGTARAPEGRGGQGGGAQGGRPSVEEIRERLVRGLALTTEQQAKLDPILKDSREQLIALRGAGPADAGRQAQAQKIREATRARIREILTPEQQARYDQLASGGPGAPTGRVFVLGADGKPRAVTVRLGISDGSATEVVGGDVPEGQQVLIGVANAARPGPSGAPPRLRL